MTGTTNGIEQVIAAELQLMDPHVRADRGRAGQLLDPEFVEVGGSGRRRTHETMIATRAGHARKADGPAGRRRYYHQATRVPSGGE